MKFAQKLLAVCAVVASGLASMPAAQAQQKTEISITRQPSILYLPSLVMEKQELIEKAAAKLGVPGVKVKWVTFSSGGAQTDALLSGSVDVVNTGVGNLLLLWDRTRGDIKGIIATSAQPLTLITRDPKIHSLKDYGPGDKIAVPTVRVSTQAILLADGRGASSTAPTSGASSTPTPCSSAIPTPPRCSRIRTARCRAISRRRRSRPMN